MLLFALLLHVASPAAEAPPKTAAAVVATVNKTLKERPRSKNAALKIKEKALRRFALQETASAKERLAAAKHLTTLSRTEKRLQSRLADALLLKARLEGLLHLEKRRSQSLRQAMAEAKRRKRRSLKTRIEKMLNDDIVYLRFARRRKKAIGPEEENDVKTLLAALWRYKKINERERALKVALTLSDRDRLKPPPDKPRLRRGNLVKWAPKGRDAAPLRKKAHRVWAERLAEEGKVSAAATAFMRADREDPRPPSSDAFGPRPPTTRSRTTSRYCRDQAPSGLDCAKLETKTFKSRTFYNFSDVKRGSFSPEYAAWVFSEYQSLVHACLADAAKRREAAGSVEVHWSISNSGRVTESDVRPRRLRNGPFHKCIREAFAQFRYPAYNGEMQHIALGFEVGG